MKKTLKIKKKNVTASFGTSVNGNPYLSLQADGDQLIELQLTERNAKQLRNWLESYLNPYNPGNV